MTGNIIYETRLKGHFISVLFLVFLLFSIWYKQDIILSIQYKILNVQDKNKIKKIVCLFACIYVCMHAYIWTYVRAPGVLGIWGEGIFIFRELGGTGNYF